LANQTLSYCELSSMFPMRFGSYVSDNLGITAGSALSSALGVYAHLVSTVTR
jgi:hypothetical protein